MNGTDIMQISLNGKAYEAKNGDTVATLLTEMELPKFFVVEHNKNIIYKESYAETALHEGDEVEVAAFCGGG